MTRIEQIELLKTLKNELLLNIEKEPVKSKVNEHVKVKVLRYKPKKRS